MPLYMLCEQSTGQCLAAFGHSAYIGILSQLILSKEIVRSTLIEGLVHIDTIDNKANLQV